MGMTDEALEEILRSEGGPYDEPEKPTEPIQLTRKQQLGLEPIPPEL